MSEKVEVAMLIANKKTTYIWLIVTLVYGVFALFLAQRPSIFVEVAHVGIFHNLAHFQLHVFSLLFLILLVPFFRNKWAALILLIVCSFLISEVLLKLFLTIFLGLSFEGYGPLWGGLAVLSSCGLLYIVSVAVRNVSSLLASLGVFLGTSLSLVSQVYFFLVQVGNCH